MTEMLKQVLIECIDSGLTAELLDLIACEAALKLHNGTGLELRRLSRSASARFG